MSGQWKLVCKLKDVPLDGARLVPRGLAWQELPGVALCRTAADQVYAVLDSSAYDAAAQEVCARSYTVKIEDGKVYLDLAELSAPASRAEAALAGAFGVATRVMAYG